MVLPEGEEPAGRGEGLRCGRRGAVSSLYLRLSCSQGGTRGGRPPGRSSDCCRCCCCCCRRRGRGGDERRGAGRGRAGRAGAACGGRGSAGGRRRRRACWSGVRLDARSGSAPPSPPSMLSASLPPRGARESKRAGGRVFAGRLPPPRRSLMAAA